MVHHQIKLNELQTHTIRPEHQNFSVEAMIDIMNILIYHWEQEYGLNKYPDLNIIKRIHWTPAVVKNRTFVKRVAEAVREYWNINLPAQALTAIGNVKGLHSTFDGEVIYDITDRLDWDAGDFGDSSSCFWSSRAGIRTAMKRDGRFYALRIWEPRERPTGIYDMALASRPGQTKIFNKQLVRGIARSWLFEDLVTVTIGKETADIPIVILFNSYGISIHQQATLLGSILNKPKQIVRLSNNDRTHGGLYVNGPGYIFGDYTAISNIKKFDFGLKNKYDVKMPEFIRTHDPIREDGFSYKINARNRARRSFDNPEQRLAAREKNRQELVRRAHDACINKTIMPLHFKIEYAHLINRSVLMHNLRSAMSNSKTREEQDKLLQLIKQVNYDVFKLINHHLINQISKEL